MVAILNALESPIDNEELLQQIAMFIRMEISHSRQNAEFGMKLGLNKSLAALLKCPSNKVQLEAAWAISNVVTVSESCREELVSVEIHCALLEVLDTAGPKVKEHVLLILASITEHSGKCKEKLLEQNIIDRIEEIMSEKYSSAEILRGCSMLLHSIFKSDPLPNNKAVLFR